MFVVFPYRSDVVARQFIWGTVSLIAANILIALVLGFPSRSGAGTEFIDQWILQFGTINPATWITSAFTHFNWWHVGFNMVFLWSFGFVVEGLLGWRRFLLLYLALVVGDGCVTQILLVGAEGGAAGASGAITALMIIAGLWSPRSELTVFVWILVFIRLAARLTVLVFCCLWIGLDVALLFLQGFSLSSEMMHVIGGSVGLGAGLLMLKKGWVETEGWDLLSLRRGEPNARRRLEMRDALRPERDPSRHRLTEALVEVRDALDAGDSVRAEDAYERGKRIEAAWILPERDLQTLIRRLIGAGRIERAIERMKEYVARYPESAIPVRLRLVQEYLETGQRMKALDEIALLDGMPLSDAQRALTRKLEQRAAAEPGSDRLELE